jgi:hypothetical protein
MGNSETAVKRLKRFRYNGDCRKKWAKTNEFPLLIIPFDAEGLIFYRASKCYFSVRQ